MVGSGGNFTGGGGGNETTSLHHYDHSYFGFGVLSLSLAICSAGAVLNYNAMSYIKRTFSLRRRTVFTLVYLDSMTSLLGMASFFAVTVLMLFGIEMRLMCSLLMGILYAPNLVGVVLTTEVSVLRYASVKLSRMNRVMDEPAVLKISLFTVALFLAMFFVYVGFHEVEGLPYSAANELCLMASPKKAYLAFVFEEIAFTFPPPPFRATPPARYPRSSSPS